MPMPKATLDTKGLAVTEFGPTIGGYITFAMTVLSGAIPVDPDYKKYVPLVLILVACLAGLFMLTRWGLKYAKARYGVDVDETAVADKVYGKIIAGAISEKEKPDAA